MNNANEEHAQVEHIIDCHLDMMIRIAFQNTKSMHDAEDVVQEVLVKLCALKPSFQSEEHLKAWLIRAVINKCHDMHKSAWRRCVELTDDIYELTNEESFMLGEVLKLPVKYRNVVYLYYYEGYSIKEISKLLDMNQNTLSSILQRARKQLKKSIMEGEEYERQSI